MHLLPIMHATSFEKVQYRKLDYFDIHPLEGCHSGTVLLQLIPVIW